eukprot:TRINITY_DN6167_c0_g2_i1.p2 TRINITY_DN6167_c0_g2~~TRINITY_DN6167_c0_g2_i1.p2  ORF type:complete len:142 (+),score=1.47 TRINITY_DN6167_c0_g2_i1:269-694(+)
MPLCSPPFPVSEKSSSITSFLLLLLFFGVVVDLLLPFVDPLGVKLGNGFLLLQSTCEPFPSLLLPQFHTHPTLTLQVSFLCCCSLLLSTTKLPFLMLSSVSPRPQASFPSFPNPFPIDPTFSPSDHRFPCFAVGALAALIL